VTNHYRSEQVIKQIFSELFAKLPRNLTYHSLSHTCMVMRDAQFLAHKLNINDHDLELMRVAISFHDYGFIWSPENHEERGCLEAKIILPRVGFSEDEITTICGMIMATKIPQSPKTLLEQIVCDADLFYLGTAYYFQISKLFEAELTHLGILKNNAQWLQIQTRFLENHNYHTEIAKNLLNDQKQQILSILKSAN
jgi:uncharacterized protein